MKTDKELLELAAKAAGLKCKWFKVKQYKKVVYQGSYAGRCLTGAIDVFGTHHTKPWNPLADDGDALRLAVKLDMCVYVNRVDEVVSAQGGYHGEHKFYENFYEDMYAATRRAIVRAAAAIGELK